MGQKVNPVSFRLPQNKDWQSRWFASDKTRYRDNLWEDIKIRRFLMERLVMAGIVRVQIERSINKFKLILYVSRPGVVIGRGGSSLEVLKKQLVKMISIPQPEKNLEIEVVEIENPELSAQLVAQRIAEQLQRRFPHRRVVNKAIERVMAAGAKGVKIVLSGRIEGAEISRVEKFGDRGQGATVPSQTLRADIDYVGFPALTRSGYIGIKVWIYKGKE
ncbi:30S ribosomal protein S3 [Candidatus Shapirobacteria bacterium CG09_land_8_20_14_0_10_49_15]|uniref:Small ribosomal subunit protein uS3 n=2 Tax=Candidatus Shapironibacteriota TaxID=1752721 RepID=A0A2M8L6U4_9BACT|nr:MAG: 30S ribosomal protein S3 [Candidatus Shapirobacteria bacterium CG09_land_8_20_14_0_10_49_15]PJE69959.1 MAG: 30S ribosomal protein S3 [Candidatus Shapirobacteria bacterium CG10_big_fil_rev_8_21_14_0_10_48_15]